MNDVWRGALIAGLLLAGAAGCSAGRHAAKGDGAWVGPREERYRVEIGSVLDAPPSAASAACAGRRRGDAASLRNTVFVHPGLLWSNQRWDFSLAADAGLLLVREGLAGAVLELQDRAGDRMRERMLADPGTRFVGVHYSMGGIPGLVQSGVLAARSASAASGRPLRYSPILVDPVGTDTYGGTLDLDDPGLGEVFIVVSRDFSFLRCDIRNASRELLTHPKTHILYAEDFGAAWGHFGFLAGVAGAAGGSGVSGARAAELFRFIVRSIASGAGGAEVRAGLAYFKVKYAGEDGRPVATAWLEQAGGFACRPGPAAGQALARPGRD